MPSKTSPDAHKLSLHFHSELARYSSGLFAAVLVALTFLLLAGLRNPKLWLLIFLYTALASFILSLIAYLLIQSLVARLATAEDKDKAAKLESTLKVIKIVHQVLFVLGLIGVSGFAIEVIMLLFPAASSTTGASSSTTTQ